MAKTYRLTPGTRAANALIRALLRAGVGPGFMRLLTVTGRRTGQPRTLPVVPVRDGGDTWLVSPYGEVSWVRNVRAATILTLRRGRTVETFRATEVGREEAVPILRRYLRSKGAGDHVRPYFDVTPESSDGEIAAEAPRHPVFALHPVDAADATGADPGAAAQP
ncbi:MAG TPA: nitroreductase family deazaflavin-dependent oxidoreductase [Acidimicrobiales bacterium]